MFIVDKWLLFNVVSLELLFNVSYIVVSVFHILSWCPLGFTTHPTESSHLLFCIKPPTVAQILLSATLFHPVLALVACSGNYFHDKLSLTNMNLIAFLFLYGRCTTFFPSLLCWILTRFSSMKLVLVWYARSDMFVWFR